MRRSHLLSGTCLSLALILTAPATAQESTRYQQWGAGGGSTQDMVNALRELVDEAESARAADPRFLGDLKALAEAFDDTAPVQLIEDDFRDGDYDNGTVWTVTGGRWWVENAVGLRSVVAAPAASPVASEPAPTETQQRRAGDDLAESILGNILDQMMRPKSSDTTSTTQQQTTQTSPSGADTAPAEIQIERAIPNAFATRLEITSRARYGEFRVGPYQVSSRDGWGYQLAYTPGGQAGLRLMRVSRGELIMIGSHDGAIDLEDGRLHVIDWNRSVSGAMTVSLDGNVLIQVADTRLRDPFDGFAITNQGGDYAVRTVSVRRGQ